MERVSVPKIEFIPAANFQASNRGIHGHGCEDPNRLCILNVSRVVNIEYVLNLSHFQRLEYDSQPFVTKVS